MSMLENMNPALSAVINELDNEIMAFFDTLDGVITTTDGGHLAPEEAPKEFLDAPDYLEEVEILDPQKKIDNLKNPKVENKNDPSSC